MSRDAITKQQDIKRRKLNLSKQQENPSTEDKSIIPAPERFDAVLNASEVPRPAPVRKNKLILSSPATYPSSGDPLQDAIDEGARLREAPIERKNGRVKSAIIRALNGASQMAREGIRTGHHNPLLLAAGGAIGGAASGAIDDLQDERAERQEAVAKNEERQGFLLKSRKEMAGIEAVETMNRLREIEAENGGRLAKQEARELERKRAAMQRYLSKYYPDGYKLGTDPDTDAELERLEMKPPPPLPKKPNVGRAFPMTPGQYVVRPDGAGSFQYFIPHDGEGNPAPDMTPAQKKDLELRGEYNDITRARVNQFSGRSARRTLNLGGQKRDSIGESLEARDAARYSGDAAAARARAAELRARGDDEAAAAWDEAARVAEENARAISGRKRSGNKTRSAAPRNSDPFNIFGRVGQ